MAEIFKEDNIWRVQASLFIRSFVHLLVLNDYFYLKFLYRKIFTMISCLIINDNVSLWSQRGIIIANRCFFELSRQLKSKVLCRIGSLEDKILAYHLWCFTTLRYHSKGKDLSLLVRHVWRKGLLKSRLSREQPDLFTGTTRILTRLRPVTSAAFP